MKQFYFKSIFLSLLMMVIGMNVASAQTEVTLWQEDFSSYSKDAVPSGGTYSYECTGANTKIYEEALAGGTSPELLLQKSSNGSLTATIPLSNIEGDLTLTFKTNNQKIKVSSSTEGITGGLEEKSAGTHTATFSGVTTSMTSITIEFLCSGSSNVRLDDIVLKGTKSASAPALIAINETNFPDDVFRAWVAENCDKAPEGGEKDGYLDDEEIAAQVIIGINNKNIEDLKGIEYFTAATMLMCDGNKLQTLDVSKNTKLTQLICYGNKLTSLNVSKNTALTSLHCTDNQLTSLNVSNNTELGMLLCQNNQLTSLDVTNNQKLTTLDCSNNLINETEMGKLVESMPTLSGDGVFYPFNLSVEDANVITTTQVDEAKSKNWIVQAWNGSTYEDYAGVEPTPETNDYYEKVTTAPSDWSGDYLIVYEEGSVAFNGGLSTLDAVGNTIEVVMNDNKIAASDAVNAAKFTIAKMEGADLYSIKAASGKYIGVTSYGNGLTSSETAIGNSLSLDASKNVVLTVTTSGGDMTLRYNKASDQKRFRYFKSGQQAIQLYKKATGPKSPLASITVKGATTEFMVNSEFVFDGKVIATYEDGSTNDVTNKAEFTDYNLSTAGNQVVTVSYTEGEVTKTTTYNITVSEVAVENITIDPSEATLLVGNTRTLTAVFEPENATHKNVTWSSNDESVATVADGVVTAVAAGTAVITVSSAAADGISATCTVTVVDELNETTATGNLNNSDSGVFAGVEGFTGGGHTVSGTLITDAGNVAVTYAGTTNTYLCDSHIRMYSSGSTLKFTAPSGFDLTKIVLTISAGNADNIYADEGTYTKTEDKVATWTGAETDVTFKGQMTTTRLAIAEVTLEKAAPKPPLASIAVDGATTDFIVNSEFVFGGTVTATYEDQTTKDVTAKATFSKPDMTTAGTQEVTVSYTEDEVTKTATYSITVREPETVTFRKVSSTDELVAGKRYVLVNEDKQKVIGEYYNLHFKVNDATISDERVELEEGAANFLTLGGTEGAWTFATSIETGQYVALTTDANYLESGSSATAESAQWTITFDENGNALIKSNKFEGRYINYNSSQPRFACYKSSDTNPYGTQQMIQLYVEADEVDVTISQVGYATLYYSDRALKLPAGVTAKTYTVAGGKLAESKTYDAGKVIPAGEAVVLKGAAGDYKFMVTTTSDEPDAGSMLKGTDEAVETEGGNFYYALQAKKKDGTGGPGFYWMNSTGAAFTNGAHKAYMALDKKFADAQEVGGAKSFYLFEEATGIRSAWTDGEAGSEQRFNLSGQRVGNGYKGIVIVNGKKFMKK